MLTWSLASTWKLCFEPAIVTVIVSAAFLDQKLLPEVSGTEAVAVEYRMAGWTLYVEALPPEALVIVTVMSTPLRLEIQGMTRDPPASG